MAAHHGIYVGTCGLARQSYERGIPSTSNNAELTDNAHGAQTPNESEGT